MARQTQGGLYLEVPVTGTGNAGYQLVAVNVVIHRSTATEAAPCWLTDNVAGNSDVDGGDTILTSPVLDTPGDGWQLSYWRWFSNDFGAGPNEDVMRIEWSEDGSSIWNMLEQVGPPELQVDGCIRALI